MTLIKIAAVIILILAVFALVQYQAMAAMEQCTLQAGSTAACGQAEPDPFSIVNMLSLKFM